MKFLIIIPAVVRGGAEEVSLKLALGMVKAGWDVHAAFPDQPGTASLIQEMRDGNITYHALEIGEYDRNACDRILYIIPRFFRTLKLLRQIQPDLVEIAIPWINMSLGSILACAWFAIPTILRFHLVPPSVFLPQWRSLLLKWAQERNQKWVTVSDNNHDLICSFFQVDSQCVARIYNSATSKIKPSKLERTAETISSDSSEEITDIQTSVRTELAIPLDSKMILTVGRMVLQKGHQDLVPVIPKLVQNFPNLVFVWAGDGEERLQLEKQLNELKIRDKVLFLGYRNDIPRLMQASDILLFPSRYEGQPLTIAEAMVYGLPIVSSSASGIPEMLHHRQHGILFEPGNSQDLLQSMQWALTHPEQLRLMADNAQQHIKNFSDEKMVHESLLLFKQHYSVCRSRIKPALTSDIEISLPINRTDY
jgi:glycosyltransferase involved in cell wall biosynthesis